MPGPEPGKEQAFMKQVMQAKSGSRDSQKEKYLAQDHMAREIEIRTAAQFYKPARPWLNPVLSLSNCVTLSKLLNLSMPRFSSSVKWGF